MEITLDTVFGNAALPINRDYDTFARADSDVAGSTEGARLPWQILAPDASLWRAGIRSNQLSLFRSELPAAAERALAVVDTGKADGVFRMRLRSITGGGPSGNGNFCFRARDHLNFLWVYANDTDKVWSLYRMVNGSAERIATGAAPSAAGLIEVRMQGSSITVSVDGVQSVATVASSFLTATKHGVVVRALTTDAMTSSRFDDFSFSDL